MLPVSPPDRDPWVRAAMPGEAVHVWFLRPGDVVSPEVLARCRSILDPGERRFHSRFGFATDAHTYLVAHALVRSALSLYADVRASALRFAAGRQGRPEIEAPAECRALRFNLSHTDGLVACAITRERDVGVDVERLARAAQIAGIAARWFSGVELSALARLEPHSRARRYGDLWTMREAYAKARGKGLSLPLTRLTFEPKGDDVFALHCDAELDDTPERWLFLRLHPTSEHCSALAARAWPTPITAVRCLDFPPTFDLAVAAGRAAA
jgi:4'-phosphopantetheinyl transferase